MPTPIPDQIIDDKYKYDLFISYSHKDKALALDISLLAMANGLHCWMDDRDIGYGESINEEAVRGIFNSKRFLLIHTESSIGSTAVQREIQTALSRKQSLTAEGKEFPIIFFRADALEISDEYKDFKYIETRPDHPLPANLKLIQFITGRDMFENYVFGGYAGIIQGGQVPQVGNYLEIFNGFSYAVLMQIKTLLFNIGTGQYPEETFDSIRQLIETSQLLSVVPQFSTWLPLGDSMFECIHPVRMHITSNIRVIDLPPEIEMTTLANNEVVTRIQFLYRETKCPVIGPFPFRVALEAEL
jgi:TIR domain